MVSELSGSRVAAMLALGELPRQRSCWGCVGRPGKGLAGGKPILLFDLLAPLSWRCSGSLVFLLSSFALLSVVAGAALTARAQVKGHKREPLLLCINRSPWSWTTHKRDALLGHAQKWCAGRRGGFYRGKTFRALRFPRPARDVEGRA